MTSGPPTTANAPPDAPRVVAIGIGGNLGDAEMELATAVELLVGMAGVSPLALSSLYASPPWGDPDQGEFRNAVLLGETQLPPGRLLVAAQAVEARMGKRPVRRWGPRVIDLDLLLYEGAESAADELRLPHPHIADRPFVYAPLGEVLALAGCSRLSAPEPSEAGRAIEPTLRRLPPAGSFPARVGPVPESLNLRLDSVKATRALAAALAPAVRRGGVVALEGPLGAGKSEFARALLHALGVEGPIPSPTYTLCREYRAPGLEIAHWDFYRLGSEDELESAGFDARGNALVVVEWADLFPGALPPDALRVRLSPAGAESRDASLARRRGVPLAAMAYAAQGVPA
ncbi:MAG: 2-amino-4-hydroxy-6-hydroxymethyldihydropteridine diphosphokinase [Candidatus Sumerlaeia bacterium]|nr:2-amino-4-hydroxy-6-hydroxymethyldihydropteridine diphosphokinase [Candidatus Sumerlaeia bacterium]